MNSFDFCFAQNSVLAKGDFYKIAITQTGVYKMDANFLRNAGIDIAKINPQNIKLFGNGGAMLPQPNSTPRPTDLLENAIYVEGESDGKFDSQDYLLFYGESSHSISYDSTNKKFTHQVNYYSDTTFYFLTIGDTSGLRMINQNSLTANKSVDTFDDFVFHELEQKNINSSGREWYGEYFGPANEQNIEVKIEGIVNNSNVRITSSVLSVAQVNSTMPFNSTMQVKLNNQLIITHSFQPIGSDRYAIKGREDVQSFSMALDGSSTLKLTYSYNGNGQSSSGAYLNFFEIQAKRKLQFNDEQTIIRSLESTTNATTNFQILQAKTDAKIWEVTNPQKVANQLFQSNGSIINFGTATAGNLKTFVLFGSQNLLTPKTIRKIDNQNLHASQEPDLLIVTSKTWQNQAERLANFRQKNDSLNVLVVTTEAIYNEFASGKSDVSAIRDFGRFLWLKNPKKLKYLLLFGDGTFDYKNYLGLQEINPNNFVPVYESRESLDPIKSHSSDDYFGFFQESDGQWEETTAGDYLLDIGIGRLPIKSVDEATGVVDKLVFYANQKKTVGKWRGQLSFVADDGDGNLHQNAAEGLSKFAVTENKDLAISKIYIDAFPKVGTGNAAKSPEVNKTIERAVNEGSLIVNYNGHGGEIGWAEEQILTIGEIQDFKNIINLPLFVTATCEFGRYDNPTLVSGAELAMLNRRGGAIGLLTTTRPVYADTNFLLDSVFFQAIFGFKNNQLPRLGDVIRLTKNNSLSGANNRNFALLGDPSMTLNYPQQRIQLTKINGNAVGKDTLKALSKITLEGSIFKDVAFKNQNATFNGTVFVTVFDKQSSLTTLGANSDGTPKMNYDLYKNQLFEGKASVKNGAFSVTFTVPKDIVYNFGKGRIQLYAINGDSTIDAIGSNNAIIVGGSIANLVTDNQPPTVQLWMNDENFKDGNVVGQSPLLIAKIADNSGINLSQAGIGHEMIVVLNDTLEIPVNQYYLAETDDFTKGTMLYGFNNLPTGNYTVKLKVWDVYNNSTETALRFIVEEEKFRILQAINYPNPFTDKTTFQIKHNREGDDLAITVEVFDETGRIFRQIEKNYYHCDNILNDLTLDGLDLVNSGRYFYRIFARSLTENLETSAYGKLFYRK